MKTCYNRSSLYQVIKLLVNVLLSSQCCFHASLLYSNCEFNWIFLQLFFIPLTKCYYLVSVVLMNCSSFLLVRFLLNETVCSTVNANVLQLTRCTCMKCVNDPTITIGKLPDNRVNHMLVYFLHHWIPIRNARSSLFLYSNITTHRMLCGTFYHTINETRSFSSCRALEIYIWKENHINANAEWPVWTFLYRLFWFVGYTHIIKNIRSSMRTTCDFRYFSKDIKNNKKKCRNPSEHTAIWIVK